MITDPRKILITFQFWDGDKAQMMKVARFLANVEPAMSDLADIAFVCRNDSSQCRDTVEYVSKKFHVHTVKSRRTEVGWPAGCAGLFFGTADWIYEHKVAKRIPDYKAFLIMEADAAPLVPDWIAKLSSAWDAANVKVLGALQTGLVHINGNALYSGDMKFLKRVSREIAGCAPQGGYDYLLHPEWVRQGMADCPLMKSWWHHPGLDKATYDRLVEEGVVFLHGIKNDSVMEQHRLRFPH